MHEPVIRNLEEYLHGDGRSTEVDEHLNKCAECKQELEAMRAQAALLRRAFRTDVEPGAGFYGRVMNRIETQAKPSVWSLFGESLFARRLAYASATFLLMAGAVFLSDPQTTAASTYPEMILAGDEMYTPVSMDPQRDREVVLVNLATYQEYE